LGRACSAHGDTRLAYKILLGWPDVKEALAVYRVTCKDGVKMDVKEMSGECELGSAGLGQGP
jgi:hypothetical protein